MGKLNDIYTKYGTDKGTKLDRYHNMHNYGDFYEIFFNKYKNQHINILEIGIQHGYSVLSHNEFFENNVDIYGLDIDLSELSFGAHDYENIHVMNGNSTDTNTFNELSARKYDIIIDDASHYHNDMIKNLYLYSNLVTDDGIYILEDIHCDYVKEYNNGCDVTDIIHFLIRHDHSNVLTPQENDEVLKKIQQVYIYEYVNDSDIINQCPMNGSSITAIIKFKNNN